MAEVLAVHQADRRANFNHDIEDLVARAAPETLDVRDGQINRMTREDVRKRFTEYFWSAEFSAWDDVEPPVVRVSPDGRMAWMIVRVRISYTETEASGKKKPVQSIDAWMAAYEKQAGKWVMVAVTSTFQGD